MAGRQAQAQAQRQEAMTNQESLQLVSTLLRVAVYRESGWGEAALWPGGLVLAPTQPSLTLPPPCPAPGPQT